MRPIVLVHGIARFDILAEILRRSKLPGENVFERFQYFHNIVDYLEQNGFENIFAPNLDFAGPSALRAAQLQTAIEFYLEQTHQTKVHIIAHSLGGLDARRMIVERQMAEKVASLTTIGVPHHGTILADHLIDNPGDDLVHAIQKFIHLDLNGLADLTTAACREFNHRALESESKNEVVYQTYASQEAEDRVFGPLLPSFRFIRRWEGANDGLVPFNSQKWTDRLIADDGTFKAVRQQEFSFPADHLNQTGWWDWEERDGVFEIADPIRQRREYEDKVKAVYLEIAQSVMHL